MSGYIGHIDILSSGSSGNCLVLYNSLKRYVIVDVGIVWDKIAKGINYKLDECKLVLSSHIHKDHTRSLSKFIDLGVPCYGNEEACNHYKGCNLLSTSIDVEDFKVQAFEVPHNVQNSAFIIDTSDEVRVLYITDTSGTKHYVDNVNCAIIEANWDAGTMFDNVVNDVVSKSNYNDHQSLDECIEYLKHIKSESLKTVILWHLSSTNINAKEAQERVKREVGIDNVIIAKSGTTINLTK